MTITAHEVAPAAALGHNRPPKTWGKRICPECGVTFAATHHAQGFCAPAHQLAFHNRNAKRGKVMLPLVQTWRGARNGGQGAKEHGAYAFRELCALADLYNAEDRKAGRVPALIVKRKAAALWQASDVAS